ncbi:unnamed protein product [Thelazia callipaeda]|uniref:TUG-UBL1 domain-containing protein n=1 Tax=Thelazia callipaeda TaxID=103827 RepID=A0A0N5D5K2_THECL|nr:unnamed protein product [Thelazia callipaeda]
MGGFCFLELSICDQKFSSFVSYGKDYCNSSWLETVSVYSSVRFMAAEINVMNFKNSQIVSEAFVCLSDVRSKFDSSSKVKGSAMNSVTVICPNSRRCIIKVTPSTPIRKYLFNLSQILEEACLKQGFDICSHELKHQKHTLDLALPLRLTGLSNNATLELVPSVHDNIVPVRVQIALQLSDGSRLLQDFQSKMNLWEILNVFSKESPHNLIKCADGQVPCCIFMNKEYRGETELKSTTLEAMGITAGRSLIRYSVVNMTADELSKLENRVAEEKERIARLEQGYEVRKTENERRLQLEIEREKIFKSELESKPRINATQELDHCEHTIRNTEVESSAHSMSIKPLNDNPVQPVTESEMPAAASDRLQHLYSLLDEIDNSLSTNTADFHARKVLSDEGHANMSTLHQRTEVMKDEKKISSVPVERCNRMPVIIRQDLELSETNTKILDETENDIDDQFFDLTVNDVQSIHRDLKAQAHAQQQRTFVSKKYVTEINQHRKEESYKHTVVRFKFSDETIVQAQFISQELVSELFEFIKENLIIMETKFDICLANHKLSPTDQKSLIDVGVAPKSSLYVQFHSSDNTFDSHFFRDKFPEASLSVADAMSREWLSVNSDYKPYIPVLTASRDVRPSGKRQQDRAGERGIPPKLSQQSLPKWFKRP